MFYHRYLLLVTESSMTRRQHLIAGTGFPLTACFSIAFIEYFFIYPAPFVPVIAGITGVPIMLIGYVYFERKNLKQVKSQLTKISISILVSLGTLFCHEAIGVLFTAVKGNPILQSVVALMLPALKFILRFFQSWLLADQAEGLSTSIVIFEVEFFNTLYTSMFMQSATNPMVLISLMAVDVIENCYFLFRLNQLALEKKRIASDVKTRDKQMRSLLAKIELVVLIEFVEVLTPVLYGIYLIVLRNVHNLKYYQVLQALSDIEFNSSIWNLAGLTLAELASLICLIGTLVHRYDLPIVKQMGFFLWECKFLVIFTMSLWLILGLAVPFTHMGNDYSFKFSKERFHIVNYQ